MKTKNAAPAIATIPAARPSSPSTRFTAFIIATIQKTVMSTETSSLKDRCLAVRQQDELHLHAGEEEDAGGEDLAGELHGGRQIAQVVDRAESEDDERPGGDPRGFATTGRRRLRNSSIE